MEYLRINPIPFHNSSQQRLKTAYDYFEGKLEEEFPIVLTGKELKDKLLCYIKAFTRLFTLLKIVVKERETAYTIFGTLNTRGKDLTDSDILKNEIFQYVEEDRRHLIKDQWDSIIESIENEDLTGYIRFHYASKYNPVKKADLFNVISKHLKTMNTIKYLDNLKSEADWFARVTLIQPQPQNWDEEIYRMLRAFKSLDITHGTPLLLTGAVLYNNEVKKFKRLVNATLVFCFRYFTILNNKVPDLERVIGQLSRACKKSY